MEKLKAKKLRRLKAQKEGWEKAFQLISRKYKPSQKVEDIQRLLKDCDNGTVNFTDRPIDAATTDELNAISKKFSIECKVQERTTRQYYTLAKEQLEHVSKEYDEFEIKCKKRQKIRRRIILLVAGVTTVLFCGFIYLDGPKYLQAEKCMDEGRYEEALNLYSQCENNVDAKLKEKMAKYQIAEAYMQDKNYETALEWYSQCEDYLDAKEKSTEAEYQIAEAYMQGKNYEVAFEWYKKCGDYKEAANEAKKARGKILAAKCAEFQLVQSEVESPEEIYTLGNEIPCGLLKYSISYEDVLNTKDDYLVKNEYSVVYGNYTLYGYNCEIKYYFNMRMLLREIEVYSPYTEGKTVFTDADIKRIGQEIEEALGVTPKIGNYFGTQYTFEKDGIVYSMDTYASQHNVGKGNQFRLTITAN
jgi:tetratricopeptide (TPR) repeat protein